MAKKYVCFTWAPTRGMKRSAKNVGFWKGDPRTEKLWELCRNQRHGIRLVWTVEILQIPVYLVQVQNFANTNVLWARAVVFPGAISCRGVSLRPSEKPTMCGRMTLFAFFFRAKCKWLKKWRLQYWFLVERKIVFPCRKDSGQLKDSNPQYRTLWDIKLHVVNPLQ